MKKLEKTGTFFGKVGKKWDIFLEKSTFMLKRERNYSFA